MAGAVFISILISFALLLMGAGSTGTWELLQENTGVSAMHMQLLRNDRVIMFDRTDFGKSNISLPAGTCRNDSSDLALTTDCTAHAVEYDVFTNTIRPLTIQTDTWCSSGSLDPDGRLIQTGGYNDGERRVRTMAPCKTCDWVEIPNALNFKRWYATNHALPNGSQIIIGGIWQFNYEYYPKTTSPAATFNLPFLFQTYDKGILNNLYPFVFLLPDGNLFIFANNRAISFNYITNTVVKTYPTIPGGDPRNYPSTGSAVLLPLKSLNGSVAAEVLICGGAPLGSYTKASNGSFVKALNTCARMRVTDRSPQWTVETMPFARVMGDMTLLPNGNVLIINGAGSGVAGWELGKDPVLSPVLYLPDSPDGSRFQVQSPSTIPRMYHSTACLLRDGRVLVGGSNPHPGYSFGVPFPTELRLEAFSPPYLHAQFKLLRPLITFPRKTAILSYAQVLLIRFQMTGTLVPALFSVTMVAPPFTTHSFSMNQRMLFLNIVSLTKIRNSTVSTYEIRAATPSSPTLSPPGFYMCFVTYQQIPSSGIWVKVM